MILIIFFSFDKLSFLLPLFYTMDVENANKLVDTFSQNIFTFVLRQQEKAEEKVV